MDANETYVRSVWVRVEFFSESTMFHAQQTVCIWIGDDCHDFPDWSAAAEFTREHKEKVRQLREEIEIIKEDLADLATVNFTERIRDIYRRILARLESELGRLTAGMVPEATA